MSNTCFPGEQKFFGGDEGPPAPPLVKTYDVVSSALISSVHFNHVSFAFSKFRIRWI